MIQYHLGMVSAAAGDKEAARQAFGIAATTPTPFPGQDEARKALPLARRGGQRGRQSRALNSSTDNRACLSRVGLRGPQHVGRCAPSPRAAGRPSRAGSAPEAPRRRAAGSVKGMD